ncbi:hypothetical protein AU255_14630 [Methyloprofundus sedimenti]|uniref:Transposase IS200-like domain-containing protein n=1 Tax=Methyloprofundus sedimenti TaxID=1420851 RepID=A0A1V8M208_9GAMM|nr:transposase [Methyloprofundus sedimenti]OQK15463.1 hypothetical protein AU255_14630 [Methyloprofundus sedimenti]
MIFLYCGDISTTEYFTDEDSRAWLRNALGNTRKCYPFTIDTWVMMTNHVHLLCTPKAHNAVSLMMQSLGSQYVRYFNFSYKRTGSLWEGRFKSCLVQEDNFLLHLYRYIELNPVRAGMVKQPSDYSWSS